MLPNHFHTAFSFLYWSGLPDYGMGPPTHSGLDLPTTINSQDSHQQICTQTNVISKISQFILSSQGKLIIIGFFLYHSPL